MRYRLLNKFLNKVSLFNANNWMNVSVTDVRLLLTQGIIHER